ncbi:MAG TPA: DUF6600 domain-containing protein [Vicinamibacterales bacterium]|nr:DUF6600 domain-containing protein [Vicinamibacterales bacterium]
MAIGLCRLSVAALVSCLIANPAYAQEPASPTPAPAPANLAFVDGTVDVVQDGVSERADPPLMLIAGDIVRARNGRAEIVFGDGTLLHLSHDTELEILGDDHLRLTTGRAIVRLSHAAARPYVIDTPASSVRLEAEGEYGIATDRTARLEVAVTRGTASVTDGSAWTVRGGERLTLAAAGAQPRIESFNTARWDAFAQWASDRTHGVAASSSAAHLPYQLRPYAPTLDHYGRWDYLAPHGYVWVPAVGASWRPYYDGSWSFTHYGWTWRGQERWAWPTHHFGRWGFNGAVWYWVPATVWAPAWVSWSVAAGYVSWAPLGWHRGLGAWPRRDHPAYAPHYNPWRGWTVVRRDHFAPRRHVRAHAIDGDRLDDVTRRTLFNQATAVTRTEPRAVTRTDPRAVARESGTIPGSRGNVRRPLPVSPAGVPAPRAGDHPAYAPPSSATAPASRSSDDRRGAVRAPQTRDASPRAPSPRESSPRESSPRASSPRASSPRAPADVQPRAGAPSGGSEGSRSAERSGAVRRGDAARPPSRSVPAANTPASTQKASPSTQKPSGTGGAARRRPGA